MAGDLVKCPCCGKQAEPWREGEQTARDGKPVDGCLVLKCPHGHVTLVVPETF